MAEEVYRSYEAVGDSAEALGDSDGVDVWQASKFITSEAISCTSASVYISFVNKDPDGDITFRIETDVADKPSGTLAHANATAVVAFADIAIGAWNKCSFTKFALPIGTYWLTTSIPIQFKNHYYGCLCAVSAVGISAFSIDYGANWYIDTDEWVNWFRIYKEIVVAESKFRDNICIQGLPGGTQVRGAINKEWVFVVKNKQQRKYAYFVPANPQTVDQQAWRAKFTAGIAAAKLLSEAEIAAYKKTAYRKKGQTWHSCFMSWYLWKESHS